MSDSVLIIGNGFDLAHGRKTHYMHFMKCIVDAIDHSSTNMSGEQLIKAFPDCKKSSLLNLLINEYRNENVIETWIDFETELHELVIRLIPFLDTFDYRHDEKTYRKGLSGVKGENGLLARSIPSIVLNDRGVLKVRAEYIDAWGRIDNQKIFVQIEKELTELSKMFEYYLVNIEPSLRDDLQPIEIISKLTPSYVISFNYTDTIESVYGISSDKVCYIHGKINKNNIVFGYNDDTNEYSDDLMFTKYYRRLINQTETISLGKLYRMEKGFPVNKTLYFYGHSLNSSDKDILFLLFSRSNKVCIYCRNEQERAQRISNLIRIIGKEKTVARIQHGEIRFDFI